MPITYRREAFATYWHDSDPREQEGISVSLVLVRMRWIYSYLREKKSGRAEGYRLHGLPQSPG